MELTNKQEQGLRIAVQRYNAGCKYTTISGYAGSGKSTLIHFIIEALDVPQDKVAYVAYTGKASLVLKEKNCPNAQTAHKLLYDARKKPDGTFSFIPKKCFDEPYKVIVIDEVSMLPLNMWELLLTHPCYIIACGDPGQLPPVDKAADNHVLDKPHVFLDEIMRQAQDSEIIRLSMHVRDGKPVSTFDLSNTEVRVFHEGDLVTGMYDWADQIICATNGKRTTINNAIRTLKGYGKEPVEGDKIISLRNHWDILSGDGKEPLINGHIGTLTKAQERTFMLPSYLYDKQLLPVMQIGMQLEDNDEFYPLMVDKSFLVDGVSTLTPRESYRISNSKKYANLLPLEFAYGYAITCHKSQGSEWNKVLIFEERFPFEKEEHTKWLYTAITRAAEKAVIII